MGAVYNFTRLKAKTADEAEKEVLALRDQAAYENGHGGYTGTWAEINGTQILHYDREPGNEEDWVDAHCEKWGPAVIIESHGHWYAGAICSS